MANDKQAKCEHPKLELDECDQLDGVDYYICPDCNKTFEAGCALANYHLNRNPWERPDNAELKEVA
jgi:hypothetical protein